MPQPSSPVFPGADGQDIVIGALQPEYNPLPAHRSLSGMVTTRWEFTWKERIQVLLGGSVWLQILTFNLPLQPLKMLTERPEKEE